jgi:hypothetical protein
MLISTEEHAADIQKIMRALASDSEGGKKRVIEAAKERPFIRATNLTGNTAFMKPTDIYCDTVELRRYFENAEEAWFANEATSGVTPVSDMWDRLGVERLPRRILFSGKLPDAIRQDSTRGETITNYSLDGFVNFMEVMGKTSNIEDRKARSITLWKFLEEHIRRDRNFFAVRIRGITTSRAVVASTPIC